MAVLLVCLIVFALALGILIAILDKSTIEDVIDRLTKPDGHHNNQ